jgi:hypothetical protein
MNGDVMDERKKIYMDCIDDAALEYSISKVWRKRIFALDRGEVLRIGASDEYIPEYVREIITQNGLYFDVRLAQSGEADFDEGLVVFRFSSHEYPDVVSFSGNNMNVV